MNRLALSLAHTYLLERLAVAVKRIIRALLDLALAAPKAAAEPKRLRRQSQLGKGIAALRLGFAFASGTGGGEHGSIASAGASGGGAAGCRLFGQIGALAAQRRSAAGWRRLGRTGAVLAGKGGAVLRGRVVMEHVGAINDTHTHLDRGATMELLIGLVGCATAAERETKRERQRERGKERKENQGHDSAGNGCGGGERGARGIERERD